MFEERMLEMEIGGRILKMSTGKIARQASGSVIMTYGETVILATVVGKKEPREGVDFFPLTVDYVEKMYASGKIPGGFFKREARPSTDATLAARMIDRPIRPLFPEGFKNDVHIVITVLSFDGVNTPDYLGIIGASAALTISDVPFLGPVAGVVVGYIDGEYVLNPSPEQLANSTIELSVAGTKDAVTMVESEAEEINEEKMLGAVMFGHEYIKKICEFQEKFRELAGKEKIEFKVDEVPREIATFIDKSKDRLAEAVSTKGKEARDTAVNGLEDEILAEYEAIHGEEEDYAVQLRYFKNYYHDLMKDVVRMSILHDKNRVDGRNVDEVRPLDVEVDLLPNPHGTALFTRGETQALVITTLGTKEDEQIIDGLKDEVRKKFYLHYNFPPYSVGEGGFMRGPGRRELGHGSLAERALKAVLPSEEEFPYTIRVVSEITESNGSSSMASVCGGSLSLMAAGVPVKSSVAGIAMGLIKEGDAHTVLTDIMGLEDHLGDMDFKVAGTREGITALQMDIKITGITESIMKEALEQALRARLHILDKMDSVLENSREDFAPNVPRMETLQIEKDKIAALIGPGGKNIKGIVEQTGAKVDIDDTGKVIIFAVDKEKLEEAMTLVKLSVKDIEVGEVYSGKVTKLMKFGAFVELIPGKEGLVHVSEIAHKRIANVEDVLKEGDKVEVKVIKKEPNGKLSLSMKVLLPKPEVKLASDIK